MSRCACAVFVCAVCAMVVARARSADLPLSTIVQVDHDGDLGAGFVVGSRGSRVFIVTARHVVADRNDAIVQGIGWQPCSTNVSVAFYPNQRLKRSADRVRCHQKLTLDLAVVEVTVPPDVLTSLKPYRIGQPASASVNFAVTVIGHPDGQPWAVVGRNRVTRYDMAVDTTQFTFTNEDIRQGFSGGPVIGDGVVGMVISREGDVHGIGAQWGAIAIALSVDDIPVNLLIGGEPSPVEFDPRLAATIEDDSARDAIRRYVYALNDHRRAEILSVYPSLDHSDLDALLGDTSRVALKLSRCKRTDGHELDVQATVATYLCDYDLTLTRRTGPRSTNKSNDTQKMTLDMSRGDHGWTITTIK